MRTILSFLTWAVLGSAAPALQSAPLPPDVTQAYLEYQDAETAGDWPRAAQAAGAAMRAAEAGGVEAETLAVLAQNYGSASLLNEDAAGAAEGLGMAVRLAHASGDADLLGDILAIFDEAAAAGWLGGSPAGDALEAIERDFEASFPADADELVWVRREILRNRSAGWLRAPYLSDEEDRILVTAMRYRAGSERPSMAGASSGQDDAMYRRAVALAETSEGRANRAVAYAIARHHIAGDRFGASGSDTALAIAIETLGELSAFAPDDAEAQAIALGTYAAMNHTDPGALPEPVRLAWCERLASGPPIPLQRAPLMYPGDLVASAREGSVRVYGVVDAAGALSEIRTETLSGSAAFARASRRAAGNWRYHPQCDRTAPWRGETAVTLDFRIGR